MRSPRVLVVAVLAFVGFYLLRLGMASSLSGGVQALALLAGAVIAVEPGTAVPPAERRTSCIA